MLRNELEQLVRQVFPGSPVITENALDVPAGNRFWVVQDTDMMPRWILPFNPEYGISAVHHWRPYNRISCMGWDFLMAAYSRQFIHYLPRVSLWGVTQANRNADCSWQEVGWNQANDPVPAIYVARPSVISKIIVTLVDPDTATPQQVVKYPRGKSAKRNIVYEADFLKKAEVLKPNLAPRLLFCDSDRGISTQAFLDAKPSSKAFTDLHLKWLFNMRTNGSTSLSEQIAKIKKRFESCFDFQQQASLSKWAKRIEDDIELPSFWTHGDFIYWNLKVQDHRHLFAIDWEEAEREGVPLYDIFHYFFLQAFLKAKNPFILPAIIENPLVKRYITEYQLNERIVKKLFHYYLLDFWCRRLEEGDNDLSDRFYRYITPVLEAGV